MGERAYYLSFSLAPGVGPKKFASLLSHFGSAKKAWEASYDELKEAEISEKTFEKFDKFRSTFDVKLYLKKIKHKQVEFLCFSDKNYPVLLKKIADPPIILFVKGRIEALSLSKSIAVVGTRKMTSYGKEVTEKLVSELVSYDFTIVSGLALGVDSIAHKTAVENNGKTIAVLGCGVDCCYPRENEMLYSQIVENNGAIASEYPLGQMPNRGTFPARNRIIAGLSSAVLVTEAGEESGALITAEHAFEQGKKVFSVPGPITSKQSLGTSILLKKDAKIVTSVDDILGEFGEHKKKQKMKQIDFESLNVSDEEKQILEIIKTEPLHIDDICRKINSTIAKLSPTISLLEMKNLIKNLGNGTFGINLF